MPSEQGRGAASRKTAQLHIGITLTAAALLPTSCALVEQEAEARVAVRGVVAGVRLALEVEAHDRRDALVVFDDHLQMPGIRLLHRQQEPIAHINAQASAATPTNACGLT